MSLHPRQSLHPGAMNANTTMPNQQSVTEQIMQLDQAITLTLQEIDQNFATATQIVTSRMLPAIKEYGVASARMWQGNKFWKAFYETSAHVSLSAHVQTESEFDSQSYQGDASRDNASAAQHSFTSDDAAQSPRSDASSIQYSELDSSLASLDRPRHHGGAATHDEFADESLAESPMADRARPAVSPPRFSNASMAAAARREAASSHAQSHSQAQSQQNPATHRTAGASRMTTSSTPKKGALLQKVLNSEHKRNKGRVSYTKIQATPISSSGKSNPFAPPSVRMWDGIVDLRKTPLTVKMNKSKAGSSSTNPHKGVRSSKATKTSRSNKENRTTRDLDEDDGSDGFESGSDPESLGWPEGMSPPVTMQFSVPQSKYAQTPAKEAAKMMVDDLLRSVGAFSPAPRAWPPRSSESAHSSSSSSQPPSSPSESRSHQQQQQQQRGPTAVSSAFRAQPVGTPLRMSRKDAKLLGKASAGRSRGGRRESMPTPPTLTKRGPSLGPASALLDHDTPGAGTGTGAGSASGALRRSGKNNEIPSSSVAAGAGAGVGAGAANASSAALLMDDGEGLELNAGDRLRSSGLQRASAVESEVDVDVDVEGALVDRVNQLGNLRLDRPGGSVKTQLPVEDYDYDDDDDDDDDDEESESESDDENDAIAGSIMSSAAKFSASSHSRLTAGAASSGSGSRHDQDTSTSGWTSSTFSFNQPKSAAAPGRSIEDDTLFGVRPPQSQSQNHHIHAASASTRDPAVGFQSNPNANSGPGSSSSASGAAGAGGRGGGANHRTDDSFKVWGHVDEMGTVHGGRPLVDRDDTYSAPSPTPFASSYTGSAAGVAGRK
ncbi:LOW QUALITY PROTEIN: hypothetical protein BCV70DRAFT_226124 [Testicularia cyperi]|uniref:DASH complex subunit ASK1 n=1 Tax=Testicularia cyperi TaxID=1882483 RepID=A0A317XT18_9BASI|nr:LOW QUALITY PROTEIN: hypothetical protein BCV70DRAFT_226124 [Testicularia cyperi]